LTLALIVSMAVGIAVSSWFAVQSAADAADARVAQGDALKAAADATAAQGDAVKAAAVAKEQEGLAKANAAEASRNERLQRRRAYFVRMNLAQRALESSLVAPRPRTARTNDPQAGGGRFSWL
jgi:hypothetical protein